VSTPPPAAAARRRLALALVWSVVFGVAAFSLSGTAYESLPHPRPLEELSYYPSGKHLKPATFGFAEAAADLAWLRAVQYYGEHRQTDNRFDRMRHVFDILTTLSPGFIPAYVFCAFALAQEGRDFAGAERLMLKGLEANPTSGALAFELGFLYYVRPGERNLHDAAHYFEQSARQKDAPPQAARFAAFSRQNAGHLLVAYELWQHVSRTSPNKYLREAAAREMLKLRAAIREGRAELAVKPLGAPQVRIGH
jgi:hypothetical protein